MKEEFPSGKKSLEDILQDIEEEEAVLVEQEEFLNEVFARQEENFDNIERLKDKRFPDEAELLEPFFAFKVKLEGLVVETRKEIEKTRIRLQNAKDARDKEKERRSIN